MQKYSRVVKTTILGNAMPILELTLDAGEAIVAEGGDVSWFTPDSPSRPPPDSARVAGVDSWAVSSG